MTSAKSFLKNLLEWVLVFAIALGCMTLVRTFVVEMFVVPSASMEDTILIGDQLVGEKVSLAMGEPVQPGQIVIFRNPDPASDNDILIKRVIATGGQTVDLLNGHVVVDGTMLDEPYTQGGSYPLVEQAAGVEVSFPYTVPEGCIWVMGDNRENSADSRFFGAVSADDVIAVAVFRYWPLDRIGALD